MHPSPVVFARFPVLYVPPTRRQAARVAAKEARLAAGGASAAHLAAARAKAAAVRRLGRAASADPTPAPSHAPPVARVAPLLASAARRSVAPFVPHRLADSLALAAAAAAAPTAATPAASAADPAAQTDSVRSFRRTTIAGASIAAEAAAPTSAGINKDIVNDIRNAVENLALGSVAKGPSFMYGITAAEAKTALVDAPLHLEKVNAGGSNAYDGLEGQEDVKTPHNSVSNSNIVERAPSIKPAEMAELLRRQISLENASMKEINKFNTLRVVQIFGRKEYDTGSPEVQAAVFTVKINAMLHHLAKFKKDKSSKRQLQAILSKRDGILKYLRSKNLAKFVETCRALGVEPDTIRV
ncbi:hypothetical protein BDR26DRAFT_929645 [Obelidium mucronatum]|nr:hypothetical protein BDR26DRAFT_929645 [Obelidium mucronatum]